MKNKMTGWTHVYGFTLMQKIKGRGFKVSTVIIFVLALVSMPLVSMLTEKEEGTSIDTVYVISDIANIDTENFILGIDEISKESELYGEVRYVAKEGPGDEINEEIENADDDYHKVLLIANYGETGLSLQLNYGKNTGVSDSDINAYADFLTTSLPDVLVNNLNIAKEQMDYINMPIVKNVVIKNSDGEMINGTETTPLSMPLYILGCFIFAVLAFILSINAEGITSSVVTEKASRIVEYLMISIKPMAIVVGKVLAMLTITLSEIILFIIGLVISVKISPMGMPEILKEFIKGTGLDHIGVLSIVLAVVIFILGFLMYSLIAALLGATVSKIEEASEASKVYAMLMFIGIYMCIALIMLQMFGMDVEVYKKIVFILPISSAIAVPFYLIIGQASLAMGIISGLIILVSLILITMFVSRVYGYILYHNGSPIKIRELFKISKDLRREEG